VVNNSQELEDRTRSAHSFGVNTLCFLPNVLEHVAFTSSLVHAIARIGIECDSVPFPFHPVESLIFQFDSKFQLSMIIISFD